MVSREERHYGNYQREMADIGMDDLGYTGRMPSAYHAPYFQYEANRRVARRNQGLGNQAINTQLEGLHNLQAYRPGGMAALTSGYYNNLSNLLLQQRTESPDLMFNWNRRIARKAREAAEGDRWMRLGGALLSTAGTVVGAIYGGPEGAALGSQAGNVLTAAGTGASTDVGYSVAGPGKSQPQGGEQAGQGQPYAPPETSPVAATTPTPTQPEGPQSPTEPAPTAASSTMATGGAGGTTAEEKQQQAAAGLSSMINEALDESSVGGMSFHDWRMSEVDGDLMALHAMSADSPATPYR